MDKDAKLPQPAQPKFDDISVDQQQGNTRKPPAFQLTNHRDELGIDLPVLDALGEALDWLDQSDTPQPQQPKEKAADPAGGDGLDLMWDAAGWLLDKAIGKPLGTGVSDPKAIIPIADLIKYVQDVEASYPKDTRLDVLTRIRQHYYSGLAFDQLIPGAPTTETVKVPTTPSAQNGNKTEVDEIRDRVLDKKKVKADTWEHLTAHANENALGDNPSPYVLLPSGEKIDLGHMLLGLDALSHPGGGMPYSSYDVPNIDPSSWAADLGIAAVWMEHHEKTGSKHGLAPVTLPKADLDAYYKMSAPVEDLLGDVDSFGMFDTAGKDSAKPLSGVLQQYYLGQSGGKADLNQRWQTFCKANGLGFTNSGGKVTWLPGVRAKWETRINRFNDLYAAGEIGAGVSAITSIFGDDPERGTWKYTPAVLTKFLDFAKTELEKELAAKP